MKINKICFEIGFILILINLVLAIWLYPHLPNSFPTHWNSAGVINGYVSKPWGPFVGTILMLCTWVFSLLVFLVISRMKSDDGETLGLITADGENIRLVRLLFGPLQLLVIIIEFIAISGVLLSAAKIM